MKYKIAKVNPTSFEGYGRGKIVETKDLTPKSKQAEGIERQSTILSEEFKTAYHKKLFNSETTSPSSSSLTKQPIEQMSNSTQKQRPPFPSPISKGRGTSNECNQATN